MLNNKKESINSPFFIKIYAKYCLVCIVSNITIQMIM